MCIIIFMHKIERFETALISIACAKDYVLGVRVRVTLVINPIVVQIPRHVSIVFDPLEN